MDKIYLEISGRGTGKTHRMINEIVKWLDSSSFNLVILLLPTMPQFIRVKNQISSIPILDSKFLDRIGHTAEYFSCIKNPHLFKIKYFYDELDFFNYRIDFPQNDEIYATTSPKFIRDFNKIDSYKDDNLVNLLKKTGGKYTSYNIIGNNYGINIDIVKEISNTTEKEAFNKEYLSNWININ